MKSLMHLKIVVLLMDNEKSAWLTFTAGCLNFLGNVKAESYKEIVEDCYTHARLWDVVRH